jgi:hypothetical protein
MTTMETRATLGPDYPGLDLDRLGFRVQAA